MYLMTNSQLFYCTQGFIMKTLGLITAISRASLFSVSSNAAIDYKSIKADNCNSNEDSSIDFCNEKVLKKVAKLADTHKPNLAGKSVLMRFWDKEMNFWMYAALNKDTKELHTIHQGISSRGKNPRNVTMRVEGNLLCGLGDKVHYAGTYKGTDYDDGSNEEDFCMTYDPAVGFGHSIVVDQKTRKFIKDMPF